MIRLVKALDAGCINITQEPGTVFVFSKYYSHFSILCDERKQGEGDTHMLYIQTMVQAELYKCVELIYDDQMHDQTFCPSLYSLCHVVN